MTQYQSQQCPLCGTSAEYRLNDGGQYKVFHCSNCKVFAISDIAERRLPKHSDSWRVEMSKRSSKLSEDFLLKIYAGEPGSNEPILVSVDPRPNWKT